MASREIKPELLLAEVEDALRTAPMLNDFGAASGSDAHLAWLGRASAAIERWDFTKGPRLQLALSKVPSDYFDACQAALSTVKMLLQQAHAELRMDLGRSSVVMATGQVFDYFDELRKVMETARSEMLVVDPYLDAEFVSRYLPHVTKGVTAWSADPFTQAGQSVAP